MPTDTLVIIGAGGHAMVVYDAVRRAGGFSHVEVRDDNPRLHGQRFMDTTIVAPTGPAEALPLHAHVAIGDNRHRLNWCVRLADHGRLPQCVVHPSAVVSREARLGGGVFAAALCVIAPEAEIGVGCIVNHGAIVDHGCKLGASVHVAPRATLGGCVTVGEGALIGAGAVILPGLSIGDWACVGAGAVVTVSVAAGETVVGIPAKARTK
jgi:sugar O-acyltransferase (sialic acid O-acetyltransferase NeuD family)